MKKYSKKWRKHHKENEARKIALGIEPVAREPQEYVCTHCHGIPFSHYRKINLDDISIDMIYDYRPIIYRPYSHSWYDGSELCSLVRKSSTYEGHCIICKTKFRLEEIEKMENLVKYLKRDDWNGDEADKLSAGIEPVRYLKDGKKITYIENIRDYYKIYHEQNPPDSSKEMFYRRDF